MSRRSILLKLVFIFAVLSAVPGASIAQKFPPYSPSMQRLQLKIVSSYAHGIYDGVIDEDSAIVLASESEHLSPSLFYDEVYNVDGSSLPGQSLIDRNDIQAAINLANHLNGVDKI